MNRQNILVLVVGVILGGLCSQWTPVADATPPDFTTSTVDSVGKYSVATGQMFGQTVGEVFYVFDHERERLVVYQVRNSGLNLLHVRNCQYDFKVDEFAAPGRQSVPPVAEMKKRVK
jgi:hypothetical protein